VTPEWISPQALGAAGFVIAIALIFLRVPIAVAMGLCGLVGGTLLNGWERSASVFASGTFESAMPYALSVVPAFILMGVLASHAGLSRNLYDGVYAFIGHFRGGLAMATIGACALFGAICGSSLATAATMARVALPEMRKRGYDTGLAAGAVAAGGTLGILIPPSIIMVIYGLLTGTSIGKLFIAGVIPGLVATLLYMAAVIVVTRQNPSLAPPGERTGWSARLRTVAAIWDVILLFSLVIGGMYMGWFSPTEAAAIGAFGAFAFAAIRRRLTVAIMGDALLETAVTTSMLFLIVVCTAIFNYFMESTGLPEALIHAVKSAELGPSTVLTLLIVFYIVLGCFLDGISMIFVTIPVVFPLVTALGFDPVWFGILMVCLVEIGMITPPVGMNLFVIAGGNPDISFSTISHGVVPFVVADCFRIAILALFPAITLWLPSLMR
jgi:tripartite ATP-independent transporter DctM subunit